MKKLIALLTALLLLHAPALAQAPSPIQDEGYRAELVKNAMPLMAIMASSAWDGFDGAPDAPTAWRALEAYCCETATDGQVFTDAQMAAMYSDLFAQGEFHRIADQVGGLFAATGEGYRFAGAGGGDAAYQVLANDFAAYTDDALYLDLSLYTLGHDVYPMDFVGNVAAVLVPNPAAYYGVQVEAWSAAPLPAFPTAQSAAQLHDQEGNSYAPHNAIDGKLDTCWAYPLTGNEDAALTLLADEPQYVRGIVLTPGYAKSEYAFSSNRRVAALTLTLSDGAKFSWDLLDVDAGYYEGTYVLPLGGLYETDSATVRVTGTYAGDRFDDVCISEIILF